MAKKFRNIVGTCPPLLDVSDMPRVPGLRVPEQFYTVALDPAPIAGMPWPSRSTPWSELGALSFCHVICLADSKPSYPLCHLQMVHATELEDLAAGGSPSNPTREEGLIRRAVRIAVGKIRLHQGIVIHCAGGTGRTGTVIGCVLRELGCDAPRVLAYLDALNKERGRPGWPEAPWQGELVVRFGETHNRSISRRRRVVRGQAC
jgi:protein-tyrosine phosphatase